MLCGDLRAMGYSAMLYHAGMTVEERKATQEAFRAERCDIVVATVAFGMGIDRPNVRFVLHTGMPKSIEHYQQEAGRAGRDGLNAECTLLYSYADVIVWDQITRRSVMESQADPAFLSSALSHLGEMANYSKGSLCRHKVLVEHFGQKFEPANCGACDVCCGRLEAPKTQISKLDFGSLDGVDTAVLERLQDWRRQTANERGWAPYSVLSDNVIRELARVMPGDLHALAEVYGLGEKKLGMFGEELLEVIGRTT